MAKKVKLDPAQPLDDVIHIGKPQPQAHTHALADEPWADQPAAETEVEAGQHGRLTTAADVKRYVLAGKATITLVSGKTGTRYTYRITQKDGEDGKRTPHFVGVLYGPDNTSDYKYMGCLFEDGSKYRRTKASKLPENDVRERALLYVWTRVLDGLLPDGVEVWHSGTCGRCGRKLTVPESIRNGIGPECATKG